MMRLREKIIIKKYQQEVKTKQKHTVVIQVKSQSSQMFQQFDFIAYVIVLNANGKNIIFNKIQIHYILGHIQI